MILRSVPGCAMWVDPLIWRSNAPDTECNRTMDKYGLYFDNFCVIIILLLDGYTMYRLREFSKRVTIRKNFLKLYFFVA